MHVGEHVAAEVLGREGRATGQHLEGDDAQAVDVAAPVEVRVPDALLRRHVGRRAHDDAGLRLPGGLAAFAEELGDAAVEDLHAVRVVRVVGEEDVLGLEIPVDDAALVRRVERQGELPRHAPRLLEAHRSCLEALRERVALEELHDQVVLAFRDAEIRDVDDVRVPDVVDRAGLVEEALDHVRDGTDGVAQHLDGGASPDDAVLGVVDGAHAAGAELRHDAPRSEMTALEVGRVPGLHRVRHGAQGRGGRGGRHVLTEYGAERGA